MAEDELNKSKDSEATLDSVKKSLENQVILMFFYRLFSLVGVCRGVILLMKVCNRLCTSNILARSRNYHFPCVR